MAVRDRPHRSPALLAFRQDGARCNPAVLNAVPALTEAETDRIEGLAGLNEIADELASALSALPGDQRTAVELRVVKERSYAELAAELGISEPTARARVSRGLRSLAREMSSPSESDLIGDKV